MIVLKHRFADHQINAETETLIVGTFNQETEGNKAEFFYGRSRNYLWKLLPTAYQEKDLKHADLHEKLSFINKQKIDFIDLISQVEVEKGQETNYSDTYFDSNKIEWKEVIPEIKKLKSLKRVCFTRKTFAGIPKMQEKIEEVQAYCIKNDIFFKAMTTPARYYSEDKQTEWTNFLHYDKR